MIMVVIAVGTMDVFGRGSSGRFAHARHHQRTRLCTRCRRNILQGLHAPAGQRHTVAVRQERQRHRFANARSCACDDGDFVLFASLIVCHFLGEFFARFELVFEACLTAAMGDLAGLLLRDAVDVRLEFLLFSVCSIACWLAFWPLV